MAKNANDKSQRQAHYDSVLQAANLHSKRGAPPVHLWNPPFCGDLDMRIARDGNWFYMGTPIGRIALVKLFASVLRYDGGDKYFLVTPVEKIGLKVDDVPFVGVELDKVTQDDGLDALVLRTNVDDTVVISQDHPLRFHVDAETGGLTPYCLIRGRLEARLGRPLLYQLADFGEKQPIGKDDWFGVKSCGSFFPMMKMIDLEHAMENSV
ncbi:MAG: DUF1285 domain-containing protein [Hyphomicrobiales bacterium]